MKIRDKLGRSQVKALGEIFPGESMTLIPEEMLIYGTDAGQRFSMPWVVVRPENVWQIQKLMRLATKEGIPVIPRARGTNVVSACVPDHGGIVLSCLKMNKILSIDPQDFTAQVEPGVITHDLQQKVKALGLFYPPDPASVRVSTIGGNIATNAGGMGAVKYGVTRDYILGLEVVLPSGEIIKTGGMVHKNVVGLDLTGILVGSEGTLGIIVKAWLKLLPRPESSATALVCFENEDSALAAAMDVAGSGILPSAMEFLPSEVLGCLAAFRPLPWPERSKSALIIRVDGSRPCVEQEIKIIQSVMKNFVHMDLAMHEDEDRIWEIRRLINPASYTLGPHKVSDDVVVPRGKVLDAIQSIRRVSQKYGLRVLAFGHIGDGNIHVNYMYDASDHSRHMEVDRARQEVLRLTLDMGGSMSGEHGVGLSKKPFISWQLGQGQLEIMRGIKKVFDPCEILNPGKIC